MSTAPAQFAEPATPGNRLEKLAGDREGQYSIVSELTTNGEFVLFGQQKITPRTLKSLIITKFSIGFTMSTQAPLPQTDSPERLPLIHPGEILQIDFLEPMAITAYRLSKDIGVTQTRIGEILAGKRSITADTALRLSRYFGNSAEFWLNLQIQCDLRQARLENADVYNQIPLAVVD